MKKHHPFGPSSFYRRILCPGSWKQEEMAEEQQLVPIDTEEAYRGTILHSLLNKSDEEAEQCLLIEKI